MNTKIPAFLEHIDDQSLLHRGNDNSLICSPSYMANSLAQIMDMEWRYEPALKQWYKFDKTHWRPTDCSLLYISNTVLELFQIKRMLLKGGEKVFNADFANSVKRLLESDPRIQIQLSDLDNENDLFNTPAGTIDLRTGLITEANPLYMISRMAKVSPADDEDGAKCPHYMQHLRFISEDNPELVRYFELFSGYCLTGHIFLQEFYTWYGDGQNGKSILWKIWHHIMGDYAGIAASGQFSIAGRTAHKEQDLRLAGKRLVIAEEVSGWDLDKLKQFTDQGSPISTREMHGKTTTFSPQCKLLFLTNNPPNLNSVDYGVQRRLKMIAFNRRIPDDMRQNRFLEQALMPEAPYILNRMIKAAVEFSKIENLQTPVAVKESSREYFDSENVLQQFFDDNCERKADEGIIFGDFYDRFSLWCLKQGCEAPSKKRTGRSLQMMGFKKSKDHDRKYMGITWLHTAPTTYMAPYTRPTDEDRYS